MSIAAPRQVGDLLFASGIGQVAALIRLGGTGQTADVVWRGTAKTAMYCVNSTPFIQ